MLVRRQNYGCGLAAGEKRREGAAIGIVEPMVELGPGVAAVGRLMRTAALGEEAGSSRLAAPPGCEMAKQERRQILVGALMGSGMSLASRRGIRERGCDCRSGGCRNAPGAEVEVCLGQTRCVAVVGDD